VEFGRASVRRTFHSMEYFDELFELVEYTRRVGAAIAIE
jgi:hypothetical protein